MSRVKVPHLCVLVTALSSSALIALRYGVDWLGAVLGVLLLVAIWWLNLASMRATFDGRPAIGSAPSPERQKKGAGT